MDTEQNAELQKAIWGMSSDWKDITGCFDGYIRNKLPGLTTSFLTYKRVCDLAPIDGFPNIHRDNFLPDYVEEQEDIYSALFNAIEGINYDNYRLVPYGNTLVPQLPHFEDSEKKDLVNPLLKEWFARFDEYSFSQDDLSEEEWVSLIRYVRRKLPEKY